MKSPKILYTAILLVFSQLISGQSSVDQWKEWNYLLGEWVGEGGGQPGQNEGTFSFRTDLNGKILVRKNHTVFPAATNSPVSVHDDLLIVYPGGQENPQEAIYFDNEGNTIKYKVSFTDNNVILTSDASTNAPRFRLTYVKIDSRTVIISFEIASPQSPETFKIYLSGKAFKVK
jgi:hypothetical protein